MRKHTAFAAGLAAATFLLINPVYADDACELPPGIDEDERYTIKFEGIKETAYKIIDVDDCWVQTFRTDGNHRWFPISRIEYMGTKELKD